MPVLRPLTSLLVALSLALGLASPASADTDLVKAALVSEVEEAAKGETFWLGVRLRMKEGWHTYWSSPGEAGLPTRVEWTLPEGAKASELHWPVPERYDDGTSISYGYADEVILLTEIMAPAEEGEHPIAAKVSWLACEEVCIPGSAELSGTLRVGAEKRAGEGRADVEKTLARLPKPSPWPVFLDVSEETLKMRVRDAKTPPLYARFIPEGEAVALRGEQRLFAGAHDFTLELPRSGIGDEPKELRGVLVLEEENGERAYAVQARPEPAEVAAVAAEVAAGADTPPAQKAELGLVEVLLLALAGGIILNLMPCVFPVLSLKVLGIAQQASEEPRRVRLHGIAYTAGILVSFAALAGVLIALRAGGAQLGWGFQLQSPTFVAILAFILFAMGLSLSGVVEFGGSVMGIGSSLASKPGLPGSFFTGVLATVVATPCTAPFMGAAVGFALTQPAITSLAVFLALGFGLALPFLALSFVPAAHRILPRPGAWMATLKELLAFPLYATVAWLVWVLHLQAGPEGLALVLAGLVLVAFAAWTYGKTRQGGLRTRRFGSVGASMACIAAVALVRLPGTAEPRAAVPTQVAGEAGAAEEFSQERLDALVAEGKPVFVNFTAAWCVTCIMNERTTLSQPGVREAFVDKGVTYLKGDWTNEDPEITAVLERFGRSGVPLYLLYPGDGKEPVVLDQILTESSVKAQLEKI